MKFLAQLVLAILLFIPAAGFAQLSDNVRADFATVEGYVVAPINGEYIVDLDARSGLQIGDILSLVTPGKKILHPVTKEVVGTVVEPTGFLQVTRILSGYSYARPVTADLKPAAGAPIRRFEQVPVVLIDETAGGSELARQLEVNLPQLHWLQTNQRDQALLTFTIGQEAIQVKNAQGDSLHTYKVTGDQLVSTTSTGLRPAVTPESGPKPGVLQQLANTVTGAFGTNNEERFADMDAAIIRQQQTDRQGIWLGPNLEGHPVGLAVADLDGDNRQETAVILDNTLHIARISGGEFQPVAEVAIPGNLQPLSMDALDLDGNGRAELYISAMYEFRPASFVVEYSGSGYDIVIDWIGWLLRAVDFPDRQGRILVGQQIDNTEQVYFGSLYQMQHQGREIVKGEALDLPRKLNVFNFSPFQNSNEQLVFAYLTEGDYLKVVDGENKELWSSADYFGGSETCFVNRKENAYDLLVPACVTTRLLRMPDNSVLAGQNDGLRFMERYQKFLKSRAVSLNWNGYSLVESWRTASQNGYLGDFALADADNDGQQELVMVVKFKHAGLVDKSRSSVVIYELQ